LRDVGRTIHLLGEQIADDSTSAVVFTDPHPSPVNRHGELFWRRRILIGDSDHPDLSEQLASSELDLAECIDVTEFGARADSRGESLVVLEGNPEFYGRLGFEHSVPCGIHIALPSWARPEAAQVLRLSNYDPSIRGHVSYPPAFDEVTAQLA
jgi:hypothetical protein